MCYNNCYGGNSWLLFLILILCCGGCGNGGICGNTCGGGCGCGSTAGCGGGNCGCSSSCC